MNIVLYQRYRCRVKIRSMANCIWLIHKEVKAAVCPTLYPLTGGNYLLTNTPEVPQF